MKRTRTQIVKDHYKLTALQKKVFITAGSIFLLLNISFGLLASFFGQSVLLFISRVLFFTFFALVPLLKISEDLKNRDRAVLIVIFHLLISLKVTLLTTAPLDISKSGDLTPLYGLALKSFSNLVILSLLYTWVLKIFFKDGKSKRESES